MGNSLGIPIKRPELTVPERFEYDVFIVYSSENFEHAIKISDFLELNGYKCCFPDRDFIPGKRIDDNITRAINFSRSAVIIFSEAFKKSDWCKFELNCLIHDSVAENLNRLIVPLIIDGITLDADCRGHRYIDIQCSSEKQWQQKLLLALRQGTTNTVLKKYELMKLSLAMEKENNLDLQKSPKGLHDLERFKYDVFIAFNFSNTEHSWKILDFLELNGYVCFHGDRDFIAGKYIAHNIFNAINSSRKVVVILSKEFMASGWCKFELELSVHTSLTQKLKHFVVPLLIDGCKIPAALHGYRYIDTLRLSEEEWRQKLLLAVRQHDTSNDSLKTYDVFFLYRTVSPDKDFVHHVVQTLEAGKKAYKCGYHERDFYPGDHIIDNISRIFKQSRRVAIVLSPAFIRSDWTKYETDLARIKTLRRRQDIALLPILLQECKIPDSLRDLTYIDAQSQSPKEWWPKLLESIEYSANTTILRQYPMLPIFAKRTNTFSGNSSSDELPANLHDVAISSTNILVTDEGNMKIKLFNLQGHLVDELLFTNKPVEVHLVLKHIFAVTFPTAYCVRIIQLHDSQVANLYSVNCKVMSPLSTHKMPDLGINIVLRNCKEADKQPSKDVDLVFLARSGELLCKIRLNLAVAMEVIYQREHGDKVEKPESESHLPSTLVTSEKQTTFATGSRARALYMPYGTCINKNRMFVLRDGNVKVYHLDGRFIGNLVLDETEAATGISASTDDFLFVSVHKDVISIFRFD